MKKSNAVEFNYEAIAHCFNGAFIPFSSPILFYAGSLPEARKKVTEIMDDPLENYLWEGGKPDKIKWVNYKKKANRRWRSLYNRKEIDAGKPSYKSSADILKEIKSILIELAIQGEFDNCDMNQFDTTLLEPAFYNGKNRYLTVDSKLGRKVYDTVEKKYIS